MPSHATGQILEKKDTVTFKIINITIPITKCRQWRNRKTLQVLGCGCWWLSLLLLNIKFFKLHHEVTASPYHWRPAVSLALSCSCCLLVEMEESYLETQICQAFQHTSILEPVLQFFKLFGWSFTLILHLCTHADTTKLVLVPWHKQNQIQNDCF